MRNFGVKLKHFTKSALFGGVMILLGEIILLSVTKGSIFMSSINIMAVIRAFSFTAICAFGAAFVIISGCIDLSIGSILCLSGLMAGIAVSQWNLPVIVGLLVALLTGILNAAVIRPQCVESTALGAAWLAGIGAGVYSGPAAVRALWKDASRFTPSMPADRRELLLAGWQAAVKKA